MGSKRKFKRDYIILEAKDINFRYKERVLPKAFAKVEVNDEKSIIALYVENLKYIKDGYKAVAIKGNHELIDLGKIILNEQGRGEFVLDLEDYDGEIKGIALLYERNIPLIGFKGNKLENYEDILFAEEEFVEDEELSEDEDDLDDDEREYEEESSEEDIDEDEEYVIEEYDDEYEDYWEDDENEELELKARTDIDDKGDSDSRIEEFNNFKDIENYNKAKEQERYSEVEYLEEDDEDEEEELDARNEVDTIIAKKNSKTKKSQKEHNNTKKSERANGITQVETGNKQAGTLLMPRQIKKGLKFFREVKPFTTDYIDNSRWWKIEINPTTLCGYTMPYLGYLNALNYTMYSDAVLHSYKYRHYLFGVQYDEYNKRKYYIYAIPGNRNEQPDNGSTGFLRYQVCDNRTNSLGYWLCFIDARQRTIVR